MCKSRGANGYGDIKGHERFPGGGRMGRSERIERQQSGGHMDA